MVRFSQLFFAVFIVLMCLFIRDPHYTIDSAPEFVPPSASTKDDPEARARWEWLRQRDPATNVIPSGIRESELAFVQSIPARFTGTPLALYKGSAAAELTTWNRRGPFNVGGRTRALPLDADDENIILAGGVSGGMYRTTNGGTSWSKTTQPLQLHSVTALAQDRRAGSTSTWYYGTGEFRGNSASATGGFFNGDGIFKSTDDGLTWSQLASTASNTPQSFDSNFDFIWNIVVDSTAAGNGAVYAPTYDAIYRSTNGGTSWTAVLGNTGTASAYTDVAIDTVLYATFSSEGTTNGIYRSVDGTTWTDIAPGVFAASYNRIVISIAPSNPNVVYFLAHTPSGGQNDHSLWKYTYVSGDGSGAGGTWVDRSTNLPAEASLTGDFDSQSSYDMLITVKPNDENTVFIGGTVLYRSTDGFASAGTTNKTRIGGYDNKDSFAIYTNRHPDIHSNVFLPSDPNTMISGHDGGLSKTTDNTASTVAWTFLNNGYHTTQFYTIGIDHASSGDNVIIGGMQDNGTDFVNSSSATASWSDIFSGDGSYLGIADSKSSYFVSSQNGNTYRLLLVSNGTETDFTKVTPTGAAGFLFINPFTLDPNDTNRMYMAAGDSIWYNSDLTGIALSSNNTTSTNWSVLSNTEGVSGGIVSAFGMSETPADTLYYGTSNGKVYRLDGASSDPAPVDVWTGKGFPASAYVSSIAVDPADAKKVMVTFSNYSVKSIFYTSNGGTSWTDVSGNLEEISDGSGNGPSVRWAEIVPAGITTVYFVGTSTGLYSATTLDGTSTIWEHESPDGIGNVVVDMIDSRETDGLVVIGTHGNGVFSANITSSLFIAVQPAGLTAQQSGADVSLSWNASPESDITHYSIYRNTSSTVTTAHKIAEVQVPTTTYLDQTVTGGVTYYYAISADKSQSNVSDLSSTVSITIDVGLSLNLASSLTVSEPAFVSISSNPSYNGSGNLTVSFTSNLPDDADVSFNSSSGLLTWQTDFESSGSYLITFTVTDGTLSATKSITLTVSDFDLTAGNNFEPDTSIIMGDDGGIVQIGGGGLYTKHKVDIPPDALPNDRTIIVRPVSTDDIPLADLARVPSAVNFIVEGFESGFTFDDSVEITIEFQDVEIENDESNMRVHI